MRHYFRGILLFAGILALTAGPVFAQGARGSIFGKVTDASGGVLPGVTVTVAGTGLQQPLTAVTTATGAYQFPSVPLGTYSVTFELASFRKAQRQNVIITSGFNAQIDMKMEIGTLSTEMTVSAAAPVVDTKKTVTGATFTKEILENIPSARDPWQVINMTPGVQAGLNVGGSSSGQQVGLSIYGTSSNVQWNLEGGSITDLASNSSPSYYNFDSFEQISVVTGGGDVSVQSSGLSINLVTKSGSNVFKGSAVYTFENDKTQWNNVSKELFNASSTGFLSGNPLQKITNASIEYGGPVMKNRLWWWAAADKQDINVGVLNYFDPSKGSFCAELAAAKKTGSLGSTITYDKLNDVQNCLANDKTVIKDINAKANYQINASNKFQYLFSSDNKYRNARGASDSTAKEATWQQTSDKPWGFASPQHSMTHTWLATDKLVFNTQYTYVHGGFYLDYQDNKSCTGAAGTSKFLNITDPYGYPQTNNPDCLWNVQSLRNVTTAFSSRSLYYSYTTKRPHHEVKTDGTYFLSNVLGGDHSLKFGLGYTTAPVQTYVHYSGGVRAYGQCVYDDPTLCGSGNFVPAGSATGIVPYEADLYRDYLFNTGWHSTFGYLQDSYSHGRWRVNGGLRFDYQDSKYLGGCVAANIVRPDLLPAQCDQATNVSSVLDPLTGEKKLDANGNEIKERIPSFTSWAPRVSVTYDLFGNGKTSVRASTGYYYQTVIRLADALSGIGSGYALLYWINDSDGTCIPGEPCWNDKNADGFVQANELIGNPYSWDPAYDPDTGILTAPGNSVDKSTKLARTREFITGAQHELIPNLAVGVEYVYRRYDNGRAGYVAGSQPGGIPCPANPVTTPCYPLSARYEGPFTYTDPITGISAPYYKLCAGCARPSGVGNITVTRKSYESYHGVNITANKRFSDNWQMNIALTLQQNPGYLPLGSYSNPTGIGEFRDGASTIARYLFKANGSYQFKWGIIASANVNINDGASRILSIYGPRSVGGGITYSTLEFEKRGTTRYKPTQLVDVGLAKVFNFRGGQNRLKLTMDTFNLFNSATVLGYTTNNKSQTANFKSPSNIVPPRVMRFGVSFTF